MLCSCCMPEKNRTGKGKKTMKISDRLYVVGGGDNSFGLTHQLDCTVYLVDGGTELALVDAGAGVEPERIIQCIRAEGFDCGKVRYVLLTHAHVDHSGGAGALSRICGAEVLAAEDAARFLREKDTDALSLSAAIASGIYPPEYEFCFCEPRPLRDRDRIQVGDIALTVLDLPGHSDGHCGYLMEREGRRMLFSGDLAFGKAKISMQKTWDCRFQPYLESLKKVQKLHIDSLLTGHQAFCLHGAYRIFDRLLSNATSMPANL